MKEKIRVLYCIETIGSGGVEQTRLTLAKYLPKHKFELKITCSYASAEMKEAFNREGVELIPLGSMKHPFDFRIHLRVQRVIKEFRPHIIHGGVFEGNSQASISGKLMGVPIRILEETSDPKNRSAKATWLLKQYCNWVDTIIAISPSVEKYLSGTAKISLKKIRKINNGVPIPELFEPEAICKLKLKLGIEEGEIVIGFVGRMYNDHKRMTDLLEAFYRLDFSHLKLLMVGGGRDFELVQDKIFELGLNEKVILTGFQKDPHPYYSIMDIFCVPSAREGFGLVAAEAMLHRLPVIASKVGGLRDIVQDGITGFLVPPFDFYAFSNCLKKLVEDSALREKMGEMGYLRALKNFTSERYCEEVETLYLELLKKNNIDIS